MPSPSVSVVLVNYGSPDDTLAAIAGLRDVDWPRASLEIVVVDNASGDDSVERIRASAPDVVLVESSSNTGFAGGCNLGARRASGDYVAFLNNDARPDRQWVRAAIEVLESDSRVGCVASKVLDWDGVLTDFVEAGMGFDGQAYKLDVGQPDDARFAQPHDILFASGAALFLPTRLFLEVGGFDERYFMFFEDVDLGWRLNLLGHRVRYEPRSIAFHRHHATAKRYGPWFEQYLLNRNALYTIYKNYGDASLAHTLVPTLLLTIRRGMALGGEDRHRLDLEAGPPLDPDPTASRELLAAIYAVDSFTAELDSLAETRAQLQQARVRSDHELAHLFRVPMGVNIDHPDYHAAFGKLTELFDVEAIFRGRRRIIIATSDALTQRMAGPAIRCWHMALALSAEHDVRIVTKMQADVSHPDFEVLGGVTPDDWHELADWCDIIVFQGFLLNDVPFLVDSSKIIVTDLYDPFHLEQLELFRHEPLDWRADVIAASVRVLNEQIVRGDFFLCASEKQRDFWLGQLSAMQRVNPYVYDRDESLNELLAVVPFGVADEPPVRTGPGVKGVVPGIEPGDKLIIWGGGIYNWFDPISLIKAVDRLRHLVPEVRLYFMGTKHPNPDVMEMRVAWEARQLAESLGLLGTYVFFNDGWVPYDERQNHLLDADVGVTTHLDHVETAFSFRTRVLDYFWVSLPVVSTGGDTLGTMIEQRGLGLTVPAEDVDALVEALHRVLTDESFAAECRKRVDEVADELRWATVLQPLVEFCRHAERAPDALVHAPILKPPPAPEPTVDPPLSAKVRRKLGGAARAWDEGGATLVVRRAQDFVRRRL